MSKTISMFTANKIMTDLSARINTHKEDALAAKSAAANFIAFNMDSPDTPAFQVARRTYAQELGQETAYVVVSAEIAYSIARLEEKAE